MTSFHTRICASVLPLPRPKGAAALFGSGASPPPPAAAGAAAAFPRPPRPPRPPPARARGPGARFPRPPGPPPPPPPRARLLGATRELLRREVDVVPADRPAVLVALGDRVLRHDVLVVQQRLAIARAEVEDRVVR